jgi:hypothetical protein
MKSGASLLISTWVPSVNIVAGDSVATLTPRKCLGFGTPAQITFDTFFVQDKV